VKDNTGSWDWYEAAGRDSEYARTDEQPDREDCCPACGRAETHIECFEDDDVECEECGDIFNPFLGEHCACDPETPEPTDRQER
jgi:hypothetical protein